MPDMDLAVFDFDGVLCDSVDVKTQAFRDLYADWGSTLQDQLAAYHLAHGGVSREEKIRYAEQTLLGRSANDTSVRALSDRFAELVVDKVISAPMLPGAMSCLESLVGLVPVAIVSATPEKELRRIVHDKKISDYFVAVHGSPAGKADHLRRLVARYDADPHRTVMVGDALSDKAAADSCGVCFLGIRGTYSANQFPPGTYVRDDLTAALDAFEHLLRLRAEGNHA